MNQVMGLASVVKKLVIDLTSPKMKKKTIEFEPVKPATLKVATTIAERVF